MCVCETKLSEQETHRVLGICIAFKLHQVCDCLYNIWLFFLFCLNAAEGGLFELRPRTFLGKAQERSQPISRCSGSLNSSLMFLLLREEMWKSAQNDSGTGDGEKRREREDKADKATGKAAPGQLRVF